MSVEDRFDRLAAARKPLESGDGGRHTMSEVGDELTGIVTKAETVDGKYGPLRLLTVDPHRAINAGTDTTAAAGEVELRCTGFELEAWFDREQPQAGDLVSLVLASLVDTGKSSPMKHYEAALKRDETSDAGAPPIGDAEADGIAALQAEGTLDDIPFDDAA
jgi:hypothetical protein